MPALASYHFLEKPLTQEWNGLKPRKFLRAVNLVLIPSLLAVLILQMNTHHFWNPRVAAYKADIYERHLGNAGNCNSLEVPVKTLSEKCIFGDDGSEPTKVYLVGDSHADQVSEPVLESASDFSLPVSISVPDGCPFVTLSVVAPLRGEEWERQCYEHNVGKLGWLQKQHRGIVIISNRGGYFTEGVRTKPDEPVLSKRAGLELYAETLASNISLLQEAGHKVLVVGVTPENMQPETWLQSCTLIALNASGCQSNLPLSDASESIRTVQKETRAIALATGATFINIDSSFCPNHTCSSVSHGRVNYRNPDHITVNLAKAMAPKFKEKLDEMLR